jgi:MoaA/NifB/PqqE/SkfB family radical SAM enzyme
VPCYAGSHSLEVQAAARNVWLANATTEAFLPQLSKLYIEPTNCCNLTCRTCVRNIWGEGPGYMSQATFDRILASLPGEASRPEEWGGQPGISSPVRGLADPVSAARAARAAAGYAPLTIFFGGFGEPLAHPAIVDMVMGAKATGARVELITNGTLLTPALSHQIVAARVDRLWVSLDGARPDSYADVRLGAELPQVLANVGALRDARRPAHKPMPEIGIAFVAMRRNIADLPELLRLGARLGARHYMISNVLPYTPEMCNEILYEHTLNAISYLQSPWVPEIKLPKFDVDERTGDVFYQVLRSNCSITFAGSNLASANDRCPFIDQQAAAIGWDGGFSPCLELLHEHVSYLKGRPRRTRRYIVGNVLERDLLDLWNDQEHQAFRSRVERFEFSPCSFCGGCELSLANEADCTGHTFPTCGGCLWAQGIIQCP